MTTYEELDLSYKATIGSGTFGRVDLAWSDVSKQHYAIKIFNIHEVVQQGHDEYVNRERDIMRCLNNPYLVKLICSNADRVNLYLVMEFAEGGELRDYLNDMNESELCNAVRFYSMEIISALRHIHSKNIVGAPTFFEAELELPDTEENKVSPMLFNIFRLTHANIVYRDLKPENILLSRSGHIKVTDFGLAKVLKGRTYTICGTAEYMAPEILSRKGYGLDVDWWSLGVVIFELISGNPPFAGATEQETCDAIKKGKLSLPVVFKEEVRVVVERLLSRDETKRSADLTSLGWYSGIDFENISDSPPFEPAPFDLADLLPLDYSAESPVSVQRERDLFAGW